MPPGYVKTIRDEILYEYAKLISNRVTGGISYPFVWDRFKALRDGEISISGTNREWLREQEEAKKACVFCGSIANLQMDHLIPRARGGSDSSDNSVLSCRSCNASRGEKGVFQWLRQNKAFTLHRLVAGKYLKLLLERHETAGTLDIDKDSIKSLCASCRNHETCEARGSSGKLTALCLESVF